MTDHEKPGTPTDRHRLGAAGMPLHTLADYRPVPADGYGALFLPDRIAKGYHVEEISDGAHYVTSGAYDTMFVATGNGVVVVDAPPLLGANLKRAIAEVTDEPVTHLIYSHWHSDHIGAAGIFTEDRPKVIAHDHTREMIERWPDLGMGRPLPAVTDTITESDSLDVNGVRFDLDYHGVNHTPGNIFIYAPRQKALAAIDIISPGWSAFKHCDASENIRGWAEAHDWILRYDFKAVVSGHVNRYGTPEDARASRDYTNDIITFAKEALDNGEELEYIERIGFSNAWVLWENYFNEMTNYVTKKTLEKVTDDGRTWAQRLAGADVMTKYHAYSILEALRLEYGMVSGFEKLILPKAGA
jgi:glyoxylase-like metal-dependent hydrolase (beta-lactamase superfamily II)